MSNTKESLIVNEIIKISERDQKIEVYRDNLLGILRGKTGPWTNFEAIISWVVNAYLNGKAWANNPRLQFTAPFIKETLYSPLYGLASFVID